VTYLLPMCTLIGFQKAGRFVFHPKGYVPPNPATARVSRSRISMIKAWKCVMMYMTDGELEGGDLLHSNVSPVVGCSDVVSFPF